MSTLDFFTSQLELLDPRFNDPLMSVSAGVDMSFKPVPFGIEATSYLKNNFGGTGTQGAQGIPWAAFNENTAPGISIDNNKLSQPVREVHRNITYSQSELEKSMRIGQPLDTAKVDALNMLYQLDLDIAVYHGDPTNFASSNFYGLTNNPSIDTADVAAGVALSTEWTTKTPDEITLDFSEIIDAAWLNAAYQFPPDTILIPPAQYSFICTQKVSDAGNISILNYVMLNSVSVKRLGALNVRPLKFLTPGDVYSPDPTKARMIAYTNNEQFVRFPLAMLQGGEASTQGWNYLRPYRYAFGQVEFIYPETVVYRDGI